MTHKLSCALFVLIGSLGTLMSTRMLFDPASFVPMLANMGGNTAPLETPDAAPLVALLGRWVASVLIGENVFCIVIALTALRRREAWAAYLMIYWPLMFASHLLMYGPGPMRIVQIVWLCLSIPAVILLITSARTKQSLQSTQQTSAALA